MKKEYKDLHYSDILGVDLKKNILSADLVIKSRFQGEVHISAIGKRDAETMEQMISENVNNYRYGGGADFKVSLLNGWVKREHDRNDKMQKMRHAV